MSQNTLAPNNGVSKHSLPLLLALLGALITLAIVALNQQAILDWIALRNYHPSDVVVNMADEDTLTAKARNIFYVNHPDISDKSSFASKCTNGKSREKTIVLGCYHGGQAGIYILQVNDPRLTGVQQVTAAHEMLHAAYDRLSKSQRAGVDSMLQDYYDHGLQDQRIKDTISAYRQSEPNDVVNEMHSIFGTEVAVLPANLEAYYKQYFMDRSKVTAYANQYQGEFSSRQTAIKSYDAQLASLKAQIDSAEADLKAKQAVISDQQAKLAAERSGGNIAAYNSGVPTYNRLVDAYNNEVATVQGLVDQYNQIVSLRNAIAIEQQALADALSTSVTPIK